MTVIQSIILGIIQGLTEFLPISSSGHLVVVPYLLKWEIPLEDAFFFDVLVQVATLLAVIVYFRDDLWKIVRAWIRTLIQREPYSDPQARLGWNLLLATIPAGVLGLILKDTVERAFGSPVATAIFLLITSGLLLLAERIGRKIRRLNELKPFDALWIGFSQALAIFPGISRSGATIVGGMSRDLERAAAARFSFMLSIPIMLAAGFLATLDLVKHPNLGSLLPVYIPGFIAAAVVGYLTIRWLLNYLIHHSLIIFSIYVAVLGCAILLLTFIGY